MSIFSNLDTGNVQSTPKDSLGGTGGFDGPTGVYLAEVVQVYGVAFDSGTRAVNVTLRIEDKELSTTLFIANKMGQTFNEYDGKRTEKAGFTRLKELVQAVTGGGLDSADVGEGMIKAWNKEEKKFTLQRNDQVFRSLSAATVYVALERQVKNKQVKVGDSYQDTNDEAVSYEIKKFANSKGLTSAEVADGTTEGTFLKEWQNKFGGKTKNTFKHNPNAVTNGEPPAVNTSSNSTQKFAF